MNGVSWTLVFIAIVLLVTIFRLMKRLEYYQNKCEEYYMSYMEEKHQAEFYYGIVERELGNEGG